MTQKEVKIMDSSIIWKSFNGELTVEEEQFLSDWLKEDPSHVEYFENSKKFFERGSSFDAKPYNKEDAWNKITTTIDQSGSKRGYVFKLGIAASLLIAASIIVFLVNRNILKTEQQIAESIGPGHSTATLLIDGIKTHSFTEDIATSFSTPQSVLRTTGATLEYISNEKETETIATNTLITPRGGEFSVILSDGTKVWLNADTRLSYPEIFRGEERRVELSGEAYFEVAHNAEKPFIVEGENHSVRVVGTSFNISAYPEDELVSTTLVEGRVMVGNESILEPGEQSQFMKETGELTVASVDTYQFVSWKNKIFYFEERRLEGIIQILARWYDFEYVIEDENKKNLLFTGGFKRYDSFESIIERIELTNEVKFKVANGKVIVQ